MKTSTATLTRFVIPLLTTEFAVWVDKNGKSRTLDVNMPQRLDSLEFQLKVKNFLSSPQCWELLCALLFCLTSPLFDLDKKGVMEPPGGSLWVWRHFRIHFALWATPEELLYLVGAFIQKGLLCWPKVLHVTSPWWLSQSLTQCYFTQIFLSRLKRGA